MLMAPRPFLPPFFRFPKTPYVVSIVKMSIIGLQNIVKVHLPTKFWVRMTNGLAERVMTDTQADPDRFYTLDRWERCGKGVTLADVTCSHITDLGS